MRRSFFCRTRSPQNVKKTSTLRPEAAAVVDRIRTGQTRSRSPLQQTIAMLFCLLPLPSIDVPSSILTAETPDSLFLDDLAVVLEGRVGVDEVHALPVEVAGPQADEPTGPVGVAVGESDVVFEGQPVVGHDLARQRCRERADPLGALDHGHGPALLHLLAGMLHDTPTKRPPPVWAPSGIPHSTPPAPRRPAPTARPRPPER